jgi:hypothetical protein
MIEQAHALYLQSEEIAQSSWIRGADILSLVTGHSDDAY